MKRIILMIACLLGMSTTAGAVAPWPRHLNPCLKGREIYGRQVFDSGLSQLLGFAREQLRRPTFYGVERGRPRLTAAIAGAFWDVSGTNFRNRGVIDALGMVYGCADFMVDFPNSRVVPSEHRALMRQVRRAHVIGSSAYRTNIARAYFSREGLRIELSGQRSALRDFLHSMEGRGPLEVFEDEMRTIIEEDTNGGPRTRVATAGTPAAGQGRPGGGRAPAVQRPGVVAPAAPSGGAGAVLAEQASAAAPVAAPSAATGTGAAVAERAGVGAAVGEAAEAEAVGAARGTGKLGGRAITAIALSLGAYDLIKRSDAAFASGQKKGQTPVGTLGRAMVGSALNATLAASEGSAQAVHNSFKTQEATLERNLCKGSFAPRGSAFDLSYGRMMMVSERIACTVRALAEKTAEGKPVLQDEDPKTLEIAQTLWAHYAKPKTAYSKSTSPGAALQCYWSSFDPKKPWAKTSFKPTRVADLCQTTK